MWFGVILVRDKFKYSVDDGDVDELHGFSKGACTAVVARLDAPGTSVNLRAVLLDMPDVACGTVASMVRLASSAAYEVT